MIETNAPKEIHVDIRSEYQKAKDRNNAPPVNTAVTAVTAATAATATATPPSEQAPEPSTEVYVKLKSYNNASNLKIHTTTNDETTNKFADAANDANAAPPPDSSKTTILREKANRYSYRGKIDEFAEHHKTFLANRRSANAAANAAATNAPDAGTPAPPPPAPAPVGYAEFKKQQMRKSAL